MPNSIKKDTSKANKTRLFTFDEMKEVWYFSTLLGATLWQYCQDTEKPLPESFDRGLFALKEKLISPLELQEVLKSRALTVGLFEELTSVSIPTETPTKEEKQNDTSSETVK